MKVERSASLKSTSVSGSGQPSVERSRSTAFGSSGFDSAGVSARETAARLGEVLPRPQAVSLDITQFMPPARAVRLEGPESLASVDFRGTNAPAQRYVVDLGDKRIPVLIGPGAVEPGMHQPEIDVIARALSRLPPEALEGINEVRVSPFRNPEDHEHASEENPDFRSDMTNGVAGVVTMYPRPRPVGDDFMAATLLHESAHSWSMKAWGQNANNSRWRGWEQAARRDGQFVSDYADNSPLEDLSETAAVYLATRGTQHFEVYRSQFPNRFALLDDLIGGL